MKTETKQTIDNYVNEGYSPGGFVRAVLENDLKGAVACADLDNRSDLVEIVQYVVSRAPMMCHGNRVRVEEWLAMKRKATT